MKHTITRFLVAGSACGCALFASGAAAIDWNVTGFVRQEIAYSISSTDNYNNRDSNPYNTRIDPHITHHLVNPANANAESSIFTTRRGTVGGIFAGFGGNNFGNTTGVIPAGFFTSSPVSCRFGYQNAIAAGSPGFFGTGTFQGQLCANQAGVVSGSNNSDPFFIGNGADLSNSLIVPGTNGATVGTGASPQAAQLINDDLNFNMFNTRVEVDVQARINPEFKAYMKVRGYFDGTRNFTDSKIGDHYANPFWGTRGTVAEWNSPDAIIDVPALYLDWNRGPLWLRLGNQTIAWGEAYFFRVMDVANGLDLRRHLVLGPGAEEYQDQRVASPGIRLSYSFNNGWEVDAFAQLFSPSILPGQNTPYNLVPVSGAFLDERDGFDDAKGAWNFGFRLSMPFSEQFTGMVAFANRRNPDGAVAGVDAPTFWQGKANGFCLGRHNNTNNLLLGLGITDPTVLGVDAMPALDTRARTMRNGCGTSFIPDAYAPSSLQYWENLGRGRIDSGNYVRNQINEFPASQWATREIFGFGDEMNFVDTMRTLEGFRSSFGNISQAVGRYFKRENVFVVGGNYIVSTDDMNSFFDQLIIRGEVSITPNKQLTNDLRLNFTKKDDIVSALILEKYHRISNAFPATYMVAQWMHRTATDMFGRDLDKNGGPSLGDFIDKTTGTFNARAFDPDGMTPEGRSSANYVVFAFQQPFPNLVWRLDMSILVDVAGGYLWQPGIRYRPAANWQWDLYANVIGSPGGDNDTITETLDFADEIFARVTYFF